MSVAIFNIPAMDCPAEEAVIRNRLGKMPGVSTLSFDLFNRRLRSFAWRRVSMLLLTTLWRER